MDVNQKCAPCENLGVDTFAVTEWGVNLLPVCYWHIQSPHDERPPVLVDVSSTVCVIKETEDSDACGEPTYTKMLTEYLFSIGGPRFQFEMTMCQDHYDRFIARLSDEVIQAYAVNEDDEHPE